MKKLFLIIALAFFGTATFANTSKTAPAINKQPLKILKHTKTSKSVASLPKECIYGFWCGAQVSGPCGMDYSILVWVQGIVCGGDGECIC